MISRCAPFPRPPPLDPLLLPANHGIGGNPNGTIGGGGIGGGASFTFGGGIYGGSSHLNGCGTLGGGTVIISFVGLMYGVILSGGLSYPVTFPIGLVNSDTPLDVDLGNIIPPALTNVVSPDISRGRDSARLSPLAFATPIVSDRALDIAFDSFEGTVNAPPLETSLNTDIPSYDDLNLVRDFSEALLLAAATAPAVDSDSTKDFPS